MQIVYSIHFLNRCSHSKAATIHLLGLPHCSTAMPTVPAGRCVQINGKDVSPPEAVQSNQSLGGFLIRALVVPPKPSVGWFVEDKLTNRCGKPMVSLGKWSTNDGCSTSLVYRRVLFRWVLASWYYWASPWSNRFWHCSSQGRLRFPQDGAL